MMSESPPVESSNRSKSRARVKKAETGALNLSLPEMLFIITIDDERGISTVSVKNTLRFSLAGAILAELAIGNKINSQEGRLQVADAALSGNALLDEVVGLIAAEQKPHKIHHWVDVLSRKQVIAQIVSQLAGRSVIRIEKKRYSWVTPYQAHPNIEASAKFWVKLRLRGIVLANEKAEPADVALLGLIKASRRLRLLFTRDERKYAGKRVDALAKSGLFSETVASLIADIEASIVSAIAEGASS